MNRSLKYIVRLAIVVAVVAGLQLATGPSRDGSSPYLSALSDLTGGSALAAPGCNSKFCAKEPGRKSPTCHQSTVQYNCSAAGNVCTITPC